MYKRKVGDDESIKAKAINESLGADGLESVGEGDGGEEISLRESPWTNGDHTGGNNE